MTNACSTLHAYLLSAFQSSGTSPTSSAAMDPATLATALMDLLAYTASQALPAVSAFVGTLGSLVTDADRLMLWLNYQYVRDHLADIAAIVMVLILAWMAWQAVRAVHRIMRVLIGMAVKLVVAGVLLAVVWNVYNSATAVGVGAGGSSSSHSPPSATAGGYAYGRGGAVSGGIVDQVFSAAKNRWMQQRTDNQQEQLGYGGEYSYAWAGAKYRNRREADMDDGL